MRRRKAHRERALVRAFGTTAAVALVLAAPAIAVSGNGRAPVGLARPKPVVAKATLLLSAPVGNSFWAHAWTARDDVVQRLRRLLDRPVELVLPAHGEPTDRAALEHVLS